MNTIPSPQAIVRHVDDCPQEILEGIKMSRVLDGIAMDSVGCEFVTLYKGQSLDTHAHKKSSSFIIILDGSGIALIDDVEYPIRRYDTVFVPAGIYHGFSAPNENLVLYGFQTPPIIRTQDEVDIFFLDGNRQGKLAKQGY